MIELFLQNPAIKEAWPGSAPYERRKEITSASENTRDRLNPARTSCKSMRLVLVSSLANWLYQHIM